MLKVAPSILSADYARLAEEVQAVEKAGADWIHLDVMDGHFVPPITIGPVVVASLRAKTQLPFDVHLMVEHPESHVPDFVKAGAQWISVHAEACTHLHRNLHQIKEFGVKAGVALNPATPLSAVEQVLGDVDYLVLMTVNPGYGGQSFIPSVVEKLRKASELAKKLDRPEPLEIQVDGGVNGETARIIERAGATVAVAGSFVYKSPDYAKAIAAVRGTQKRL
jgi:ribulose-phosphate 3-epimerase